MITFDIPAESKAIQRKRLLAALREHRTITTDDAREYLNISHPAGRIKELRESGHRIVTEMRWTYDHNEYKRRLAHYVYEGASHAE